MAILEINVKDEIIKEFGDQFTKDFLEKQLEILRLENIMSQMGTKIKDSKINYEEELEKVRNEAWKIHKKDFLS